MDKQLDKEKIDEIINKEKMVLLYFGEDTCSVCRDMKPKILNILDKYKNIESLFIKVNENLELTREFSIFTIPAVLVYTESKESIREARYLSINKLEEDIDRYYNLIFDGQEVL